MRRYPFHPTGLSPWISTLDDLMASLASRMPSDGSEYRIGWCSATHCRPEVLSHSGASWGPLRAGIGFLDPSKTYWMLVFAIEMLDRARELNRGPYYQPCHFCGRADDEDG